MSPQPKSSGSILLPSLPPHGAGSSSHLLHSTAFLTSKFSDMLSADYSNRLVFSLCEELLHKDAFTHLPDALVAAQEFIRQHLSENIGLEDVAKSAGVSVSYLGSLFRQYLNCTPRGEIERQRINRCKVLLSTTQMPITDIALGSGYRDSGYFSRVFHRIHRMSPSAFREQKLQ